MKRAKCFCPKKEKENLCFYFLIKVCHEIFFFTSTAQFFGICTFEGKYFFFHRVGHGKRWVFSSSSFSISDSHFEFKSYFVSGFLVPSIFSIYLFLWLFKLTFNVFFASSYSRNQSPWKYLLYLYSSESFFCSLLFCMKPRFAWLNIHIIKFYRFWMFGFLGLCNVWNFFKAETKSQHANHQATIWINIFSNWNMQSMVSHLQKTKINSTRNESLMKLILIKCRFFLLSFVNKNPIQYAIQIKRGCFSLKLEFLFVG